MVDTDHVLLEKDGDVARVWLNRPHKKNAVTVELLHRLDEIIKEVDADPDLKVLVLRGVENPFCSGFDLDELLPDYIGTTMAMDVAVLSAEVCDRLYSMKTPVDRRPRGIRDRRRLRADDLLRLRDRGGRRPDR